MTSTNPPEDRPHTHYHKDHPHNHPYWKRAHRDWKIWVMVAVMLGAMWIYLKTNDLSVQPSGKTQQPVP